MIARESSILPLEIEGVSFSIGQKRLIKDISCRITGPGISIIVGPNGAGKSLFLRLCHGLIEPTQGHIYWQGAPNQNPRIYQAMVFQRPTMLRRSVSANIDFALSLRNHKRNKRKILISEALERAGLSRFAKTPARVLSFGEQQRLALARAWALRPQVLFLDEPTANIDPAGTHLMEQEIKAICAEGTKIVMCTHDLGQARRLADDVIFLHRGRVLEKSSAKIFFSSPSNKLAQAFLRGELLWWHRKQLTPP